LKTQQGNGVSVVVRDWESQLHGEGKQLNLINTMRNGGDPLLISKDVLIGLSKHKLIIYKFDGEPDTLRGVSPVRRKGRVTLSLRGEEGDSFPSSYKNALFLPFFLKVKNGK